jgi:NADH:ubiquinone oxidoreductase subunit 6 (subunit J)
MTNPGVMTIATLSYPTCEVFQADYYFLGLTYIIVYCGAIAILFLFVIMMVTYGLYGGALY